MRYKSISIIIIFISLFVEIQAQYNHEIRAAWHSGYILKHRSKVKHLVRGPIRGVELNYIRPTNGSKRWHNLNLYPDLGFGFSYYHLNNNKELGELYAMHALMDLYLIRKEKSFLTFRLSSGLTYASKIFDEKTNSKNEFLSSRLSSFINLRWAFGYRMSDRLTSEIAVGIAHTSNGALQQPNLGINLITSSFNLRYRLNTNFHNQQYLTINQAKPKHIYQAHLAYGKRAGSSITGEVIRCGTLAFNYYRSVNYTNAIGAGIDLFVRDNPSPGFDFITFEFKPQQQTYFQIGFKLNYMYRVGRVDFPFEVGLYAYDHYKSNGTLYNRMGLRYHLYKNCMANITLKLHQFKADYIEWGIGYDF